MKNERHESCLYNAVVTQIWTVIANTHNFQHAMHTFGHCLLPLGLQQQEVMEPYQLKVMMVFDHGVRGIVGRLSQ